MHWEWLWHRLVSDFWPIDKSTVAPNLLASVIQWAIIGLLAAIFYPPLRHFIAREWNHLHAKLDAHAELLEHIIRHHPDIPPHSVKVPKGRPPRGDR